MRSFRQNPKTHLLPITFYLLLQVTTTLFTLSFQDIVPDDFYILDDTPSNSSQSYSSQPNSYYYGSSSSQDPYNVNNNNNYSSNYSASVDPSDSSPDEVIYLPISTFLTLLRTQTTPLTRSTPNSPDPGNAIGMPNTNSSSTKYEISSKFLTHSPNLSVNSPNSAT